MRPRRYRSVRVSNHPLRPGEKSVVIPAHRVVLYDKIGPGHHPCHWCGTMLEWNDQGTRAGSLNVDHLDGDGCNNDPANLVPTCHSCNCSRHNPNTLAKGELWVYQGRQKRRAIQTTCEVCGETFLHPATDKRRFCSHRCFGLRPQEPVAPRAKKTVRYRANLSVVVEVAAENQEYAQQTLDSLVARLNGRRVWGALMLDVEASQMSER